MKDRYSGFLYNALLLATDVIVVYGLLCASLWLYKTYDKDYSLSVCLDLWYVPLIAVVINFFARLYSDSFFCPGFGLNTVEQLKRITLSLLATYVVLFSYLGITRTTNSYSRVGLAGGLLLAIIFLPFIRLTLPRLCRLMGIFRKRILIAGAGKSGRALAEQMRHSNAFNVQIVGFLDDRKKDKDVIGRLCDYERVAKDYDVSYVAVALPLAAQQKWTGGFIRTFKHILWLSENRDLPIMRSYPMPVGMFCALEITNRLCMPTYRACKKVSEFFLAVLVLPFILPMCILIGLLVKLTSRGPIFYKAKRIGMGGKEIYVLKFRTMYQDADAILEEMLEENPDMKKEWEERFKLKNDPRITPLGKILRKTSLDELPQFWNVIRGEMSIIGPRPIVTKEIQYYGEKFDVFSVVKPGITGLWQVSGRSDTNYETRVALDAYYVSNWSVWLDYYILLKTVVSVLMHKGAE